jgi:hypothetical protein
LYLALALFLIFIAPSRTVQAEEAKADKPAQSFEERFSDKSFVALLDEQEIRVNGDWSFTRRVHRKIRIQKDDAKDMGEISVDYNKAFDRITEWKGVTITPDGKSHAMTRSQDMAMYEGESMYSNSMLRVMSLPAVSVGSVLDASWTISSSGLPMKNAFWEEDSLSFAAPVKEYRYTITFPRKLNIRYREFGLSHKPEITEKGGFVTYRWAFSELYDGTREEEYSPPPSPDDPAEAFEFSSVASWDDFAQWYAGLVDKNTVITPEIMAAAKAAVGDRELVQDKVRAILEYVQDNFRYVSMSFGMNAFEPHPTTEVFTNKYGDCKDLSLLTRAMLSVVGVKSSLALFRTEEEISDPAFDLPIPSLFDHALLLVRDPLAGDFYADPLLKGYDIKEYPMNYQRAYTFVVDGKKGFFARLPEFDAERTAERFTDVVDIQEDWSGVHEFSRVWGLGDSIEMREKFKTMNEAEKKEYFEKIEFTLAQGGEVKERSIDGLDRRYGRLRTRVVCRRPEEFPSADGLIVIDLTGLDRDAAFEKKERRKPFFFAENVLVENETIYRIPGGFGVFSIPADLKVEGLNVTYTRTVKRVPLGVKVKEALRLRRMTLPKEALKQLREFRARLSRDTRQRIVFRKK